MTFTHDQHWLEQKGRRNLHTKKANDDEKFALEIKLATKLEKPNVIWATAKLGKTVVKH